MIKIDVDVDSDLLQQLAYRLPTIFGEKVAPATQAAFAHSANYIRETWAKWAMGDNKIQGAPDIKTPNSRLAGSIRIKKNGPFDAEIYTESPHMKRIQEGTPTLDMKTTHPYGKKSRVSKKGIPYLIVPFRWGTPNDKGEARAHMVNFITVEAFKTIKKLKPSKKLSITDKQGEIIDGPTHTEKNFHGQDIPRQEYEWGGRHTGDGDMDGMVRMRGKGGYFTFRVITPESEGWIRRAVPAVDIIGPLENTVRPYVEDMIQAGLEADIGI